MNDGEIGHHPMRPILGEERHSLAMAKLAFKPRSNSINLGYRFAPGVVCAARLHKVPHPDLVRLGFSPVAGLFS